MFAIRLPLILALAGLLGCAGQDTKSNYATPFAPCGDRPNCVSSEDAREDYNIQRLKLSVPAARAWSVITQQAKKLPKLEVIEERANYLHVVSRSRIMNFTDHIELQLNPSDNSLSIKSASVTGYSDMGVNRARVEALYQALRDSKIAR